MNRSRIWKLLLIAGLICYTGFVIAVRVPPISGYELSIYQAVPLLGWVLLSLVVITGVTLILSYNTPKAQLSGCSLFILFAIGMGGLPLLRGYEAFGSLDTLVHIGFINEILVGRDISGDILYPGMHHSAALLVRVLEISIGRALLICLAAHALCFVVFTELSTRRVLSPRQATGYGAIIGVVFAPIMTVQLAVMNPVPATLAIFFLSVCIYAFIGYLSNDSRKGWRFLFISLPVVLAVLHPQHAVAFTLSLGGIAIATSFINRKEWVHIRPRVFFLVAIIITMVVFLLVSSNPVFSGFFVSTLSGIFAGGTSAGAISGTATGLTDIGGSIVGLALKILIPKVVISLTATGVVLYAIRELIKECATSRLNASIIYLGAGAVPVTGLVFASFAAALLNQATRYAGFILVLGSVLSGIGLALTDSFAQKRPKFKAVIGIVAIVLILLSVPALYSSPYVYQGSNHLPESEFTGYEFAFDHQDPEIGIASTRSRVDRHQMVYEGRIATINDPRNASLKTGRESTYFAPYHFNETSPSQSINETTYLVLPSADRKIDLELYNGYRYTEDDYRQLETDQQVVKFYSNGHFNEYLISDRQG